MNKSVIRTRQMLRQIDYPSDRIAFRRDAVKADREALIKYATDSHTSMQWLRRQIAKNNQLDTFFDNEMIPSEATERLIKTLGWDRKIKDPIDTEVEKEWEEVR